MVNVDVSCMRGVYVEEITKKRNDDLLKGGGFKGFFFTNICEYRQNLGKTGFEFKTLWKL